jgi:hypothetical protein
MFCFAQNQENLVDDLFKSRIEYVRSIPDTFKFFYNSFVKMDNKLIADTLKSFLSNTLREMGFYLIEFVPDGYMTNKQGVCWTKHDTIVYRWDNVNRSLKIINDRSVNNTFLKDVEDWNEFVIDRSYRFTSIAGGSYIFCSKVVIEEGRTKIDNTLFREYLKDHFMYYLKEQQIDMFTPRIKVNCPWYKKHDNEINWEYFENYKKRGIKVFNCDGKEL